MEYDATWYFVTKVQPFREYATMELCVWIIENAVYRETEQNGRIRHWAYVESLEGRAVRVVTLNDGRTIHNPFIDRGFVRRNRQ